ncbi:hypothetical protein [Escherichia coli]|uniref:hypothetical protein n=1 Tax=Escherichia coli TaxID=562 RepID=UPI00388FABD5
MFLLISGLATLVVAGVGYAISRLLSPGINDFMIDVPGLLLPSAGHGEASDVFSSAMPFTSAFSVATFIATVHHYPGGDCSCVRCF